MRIPPGGIVDIFMQIMNLPTSDPIEFSGDPIEQGGHDGGLAPIPGDEFVNSDPAQAQFQRLLGAVGGTPPDAGEQ